MIAAGFPIVGLLVRYFKITPGTCYPPDEGLPGQECQFLTRAAQ
jgi:hypothetical protein